MIYINKFVSVDGTVQNQFRLYLLNIHILAAAILNCQLNMHLYGTGIYLCTPSKLYLLTRSGLCDRNVAVEML